MHEPSLLTTRLRFEDELQMIEGVIIFVQDMDPLQLDVTYPQHPCLTHTNALTSVQHEELRMWVCRKWMRILREAQWTVDSVDVCVKS